MKPSHTPPRSIRVPDDVWQSAKSAAADRGETVTDAVVRFLRRYGKSGFGDWLQATPTRLSASEIRARDEYVERAYHARRNP